ncbi:MAG: S-layer homology domain-containing protein [Clostridia bacterium]|nr:S-layer homology domain-containing protein [Clostridia bacterium]
MNFKKRIFASVLTLILILSAIPVNASVTIETASLPFEDAQSGWFVPAVSFCYANEIMSGKSENSFDPKGVTTREQMMTVLAKLDGDDTVYSQCTFTDVRSDVWYTPYVNMAIAKGYSRGISDTLFGIGKTLTRQETVTLIYNFAVANCYSTVNTGDLTVFEDTTEVADWASEAFSWAVGKAIISGSNGKLNPRGAISRAELAQVIRTFMENVVFADCEHDFGTKACSEITACTLCGMKNWPTGHICPVYNCAEGSRCEICGEMMAPKGHSYEAADCTNPMTCTVCNGTLGEALGHTTDSGICKRCGKEFFASVYDKFVYCMTEMGMTDSSDPNTKYLKANVTHTDGATSTQYVKYNKSLDRTVFEIIYKFAGSSHTVKTTITMDFEPSGGYHVESYYSTTGDLQHANYYGSGIITASDSSFKLNGYSGDSAYRDQFDAIAKGTLLLNIDASNKLIKDFCGITMSDFGFTNFN